MLPTLDELVTWAVVLVLCSVAGGLVGCTLFFAVLDLVGAAR